MEVIGVADIDAWIRRHDGPGRHEARLQSAVRRGALAERGRDPHERARALFLRVFARLVRAYGGPDFTALAGWDWRNVLGLPAGRVAVWDFDYYQLSLRDESQGSEDGFVVLAAHHPDPAAAADRPRERR